MLKSSSKYYVSLLNTELTKKKNSSKNESFILLMKISNLYFIYWFIFFYGLALLVFFCLRACVNACIHTIVYDMYKVEFIRDMFIIFRWNFMREKATYSFWRVGDCPHYIFETNKEKKNIVNLIIDNMFVYFILMCYHEFNNNIRWKCL